jgi:hypothetical protein
MAIACGPTRAFTVCAGTIAARRAVEGLLLLALTVGLSSCGKPDKAPPPKAAPPPATSPKSTPSEPEGPVTGAAPSPKPTDTSKKPPTVAAEKPAPVPPPNTSKALPPPAGGEAPERRPPQGLPAFPWPPPRYSAFATIARAWVASGAPTTLGTVASRLEAAFDAAGYGERSYYWIPGGFALVSRIEQIRSDAAPVEPPARWAVETPRVREGFIDHIRALFNAPPGFYRVIVFTVTDQAFAASERPPTSSEARTWISSGTLRLPESVSSLAYSDEHYTTALIYEFERRADQTEATMRMPSDSPGRVHLEKAGLWKALARP